jgi:hypothetical protein
MNIDYKEVVNIVVWVVTLAFIFLIIGAVEQGTDWDYICTSYWRWTKPYTAVCILKGYPLFGE